MMRALEAASQLAAIGFLSLAVAGGGWLLHDRERRRARIGRRAAHSAPSHVHVRPSATVVDWAREGWAD